MFVVWYVVVVWLGVFAPIVMSVLITFAASAYDILYETLTFIIFLSCFIV